MTITTDDCKNAILKFFSDQPEYPTEAKKISDITRLRKYKNTSGLWVRTFSHLGCEKFEELHIYVIEQDDGSLTVQPYPDNWTWYYFFEETEEGDDNIWLFIFPKYPGYQPYDQHITTMLTGLITSEFDEVQEMCFVYCGDKTKEEVKEYLESKGFIHQEKQDYLDEIYGNR